MRALRIVQLCVVTLSVAVLSCRQQTNVEEVKKAIEEADARQLKAFADKNIEGMMANYAPDAVILPQNGPMVTGREDMEVFFTEMSGMMSDFTFSMKSLDASGDLAYEIGSYSGTMHLPGMGTVADKGKFLTVWKRQADGKWKIVADIFNTDIPASMEESVAKK